MIGGGLAGLSAAAALGGAGFHVEVFEARPFLGGRATSFPLSPADDASELIDNCQHVLLRCCVNLLDFYGRLGVKDLISFYREFVFIEPGGRISSLRRERTRRHDLDRITMLDWLREKRQTPRAIERFWRQVLVSAINEDVDRIAARHGFQVFWLGFLARADSYEMGVPAIPLGELYRAELWRAAGDVSLRLRCLVESIGPEGILSGGRRHSADYYICALPFERLTALGLPAPAFEHSPITGIHLWFDRPVTDLPHATLLDRTIQWMFNKSEGRYLQLVVSASRSLAAMGRAEIISLATAELAEFLPRVRQARLEKAHVIKELRATFSAAPGTEALRPSTHTSRPDLFLAGDWTRSGWPATMEGAVRSGYLAAEAVAKASGRPVSFLLPDIA